MNRFPNEVEIDRPFDDESRRIRSLERADRAIYSSRPDSFRAESARPQTGESSSNLLIDYYRTIVRHRVLIGSLAAIGVLASVLLHLTTQPVYETHTSLEIQSVNGDFMNMRSINPTGEVSASSSETNVQTQIKLLQSDSLMEQVEQRLQDEPHPAYVLRNDLLSKFKRGLHLGHGQPIAFNDLLDETVKGVKVKPSGITRLVEVTCDSWDAEFAAKFCNVLTSEFQSKDLESRGSAAKRTSDWLTRQAADVRLKAEDSERKLEAATGGNGLILSQQSDTVGEDRLRQIQAELVKAQAERMEKEAESSVAQSAPIGTEPSVLNGATYLALQKKLLDLQSNVAELVPPLTEANPKVIHLRSQIKEVQGAMAEERTASLQRLDNQYAAAKHREGLLSLAYHTQESSVSSDLQKGSQVGLLRREVESEQQLYQTLLQRAKEAGFASAMQAATIRVVDAAKKPRFALFPQRRTAATVGLILGSLIGIAIAFFKDRSTIVFRVPGESERFLQVEELGVIPSPMHTRSKLLEPLRNVGALGRLPSPASPGDSALATAGWTEEFSIVAEAYRNATVSILMSETTKRARVYVVTSPSAGDGKTTVAVNLGVALSKAKLRVVLIDGDLRKPSLHRALSVPNKVGLRSILRGGIDVFAPSLREFCQPTEFPTLSIVTSGTGQEEVVELLHSPHFGDLLHRLSKEFDVILVDSPPILHMADARILSRQSDGAILILRSGVTTREQGQSARDLLDHDRIRVVGTILNDFDPAKEGKAGYYSSYYRYQKQTQPEEGLALRS